jgi:DNA-binding transcriptional LysR family regulator
VGRGNRGLDADIAEGRDHVEVDVSASWSLSRVASTELVALVPSSALQSPVARDLRVVDVEGLKLARTITLLSRPAPTWSPLMQEFVQALKDGGRRVARPRGGA